MGIFYTNITLLKVEEKKVVDILKKAKRTTYVLRSQQNHIVVYDKECEDQDTRILCNLTSWLSKKLKCIALAALVHDGDLLLYWLYDKGRLVSEYNSAPDYFDDREIKHKSLSSREQSERLCATFNMTSSMVNIENVFELAKNDELIGEQIHQELVNLLDLPQFAVEVGFYTIENEVLPEELKSLPFQKT